MTGGMAMDFEYREQAKELRQVAKRFYLLRYQMSNGGNLSIRIAGKEQMMVKATDVAFHEVGRDTVVITDFDGNVIAGDRKPSKEALLHGALYRAFPQIGAVMHCHSPYATAWAAAHEELDFATHHSRMKLGGYVPVFDTHSYAVPKEYFPHILENLAEHPGAFGFLLRAHGQVTMGRDMREAAYLAELVEETAQISILSGNI